MEFHHFDDWAEPLELIAPVSKRGLGCDDNVGALDATELMQVRNQGDRLESLTQTLRQTRRGIVLGHARLAGSELPLDSMLVTSLRCI